MLVRQSKKCLELSPSPTNCQCPKMDTHFEYVITKHGTASIDTRVGPSLDTLLA